MLQSAFTGPTCPVPTAATVAVYYKVNLPVGCYTTSNQLTAPASTLTVSNPTTPVVSATNVVASSICEGDTTTFSLSTSAIPVGSTYQWYSDNVAVS